MSQVEGIPVGYKLVRVGHVGIGEMYLDGCGDIRTAIHQSPFFYLVVAFDNVYNKPLESVTIPAGYEKCGEKVEEWFREPQQGESFITQHKNTEHFNAYRLSEGYVDQDQDFRRIILRPVTPKTKRVLVIECDVDPTETIKEVQVCVGRNEYGAKWRYVPSDDVTSRIEDRPIV